MVMRVERSWMPAGDTGTRMTVGRMKSLARSGSYHPTVRAQAGQLLAYIDSRDYASQIRALRGWMVAHFRFLRDPAGVELLHAPDLLLRQAARLGYTQGDCDDAAVLSAALAKSVGLQARLVVVGFRKGGPFQHVWAEVWQPVDKKWVEFDVTRTSQDLDAKVVRKFITLV